MAVVKPQPWRNVITLKRNTTRQENTELSLYFNNLVLYFLLKLNYTEFLKKAKGGTDSYGVKWKPLAEKTIKYKRKKRLLYSGKVAINIRTRQLMIALKPNKFSNGVYVAGPGQRVKVNTTTIYFETKVPYIDEVDSVRPVIIDDMDSLVNDAVQASLPKFKAFIRSKGL